jgi:CCR4-NOT transcriptional regulation complex NOT5 subunit
MFHKKFSIWLKKSEAKGIYEQTDKFTKGQFVYFDYEKGWLNE